MAAFSLFQLISRQTFASDVVPVDDIGHPSSSPYQLAFTNCDNTTITSVARILDIELQAVSKATAQWIAAKRPQIQVVCDTSQIHVQVTASQNKQRSGQTLSNDSGFQSDPGRFVALTIIELLATQANSSKSAPRSLSHPQTRVTIKSGKLIQQTERPLPQHRVQLFFSLFGGQKPFALLPGAGLRYGYYNRFHLGLQTDVQFHSVNQKVPPGTVRSRYMTGAVLGVAWFRHHKGIVSLGPGFRAGALQYTGAADDSDSVDASRTRGPFGGPVITLQGILLLPHFGIGLSIEGGYTIWEVGAIADDEVAISQNGFWGILTIGVGVNLK